MRGKAAPPRYGNSAASNRMVSLLTIYMEWSFCHIPIMALNCAII